MLEPYMGHLMLKAITGDSIWQVIEAELAKVNKPATVNRYLATIRSLLRIARDEWQWIDSFSKVHMLGDEAERDRWLSKQEADLLLVAMN